MKVGIISFGNLVNQADSDIPGHKLQARKPSIPAAADISNQFRIKENSPFVPAINLELPIRLGRISNSESDLKKVSLVIHPNASNERVFYAESKFKNLNDAIKNLREREGIPADDYASIGYVNVISGNSRSQHTMVADRIKEWARQNHFDAVIWTDLPPRGVDFSPQSTGTEVLPILARDPILLQNTKKYIAELPTQPNSLQREILAIPLEIPDAAYKASLTADFGQRDAMAQTNTRRDEWFHRDWGTWGPYARQLPVVDVPRGVDPIEWKRDRIVEVAKHYRGLPYKRNDGMRGHFPDRGCGLDCSNFVSWVYNYGLGKLFTSDVDELWSNQQGRKLSRNEQPKKGDLVFYDGNPKHVVIYIDENHIIDSTSACREGVDVRDTRESRHLWCRPTGDNSRVLGFKRFIE